ncbi:MAG: hypothetical protein DCC88_07865 [Spirobacillus cienkowskii]|jgi:hypothetical protein|uniref:Peptidase S8/S53 domain-containing protein n=1 Tax=Spirobacillus cienkowskii TaxID=495820 RepID=A0A369KPX2_9BACT|nr:MAG: hypothetical protein DCC88_07865 [Spirobacillus cienkowskii]
MINKKKLYNYLNLFTATLFLSCSNTDDENIDVVKDKIYILETGLTDNELDSYGKKVVYRFKSINNLVALNNNSQLKNNYVNSSLYKIIEENAKVRIDYNFNKFLSNKKYNEIFIRTYSEANFDKALDRINSANISLQKVNVAIVDSGVVPVTRAIKAKLKFSINLTNDSSDPFKIISSHATYLASIFAGIDEYFSIKNVYAKNAELYSYRVNVTRDSSQTEKKYGSLQLAVAIDEAVFHNAKIVNLSLSYLSKPYDSSIFIEKILISNAAKKGIVFVVPAGNENMNIDTQEVYPSRYDLNNVVTVSSHNNQLVRAYNSNYGLNVDLSAQGISLHLTNNKGNLDFVSGTSFSVAVVAAAMSLYYGAFPAASLNTMLDHLFMSANDYNNTNENEIISKYGRLDVDRFIKLGMVND